MVCWKLQLCCVLLISLVDLIQCSRFENCRVDLTLAQGPANTYYLHDLEKNLPRENEVFRTKVYFTGLMPFFSFHNSGESIVFGKYFSIIECFDENLYFLQDIMEIQLLLLSTKNAVFLMIKFIRVGETTQSFTRIIRK